MTADMKPKTISAEQMAHMIRVYNSMQMALYFLNEFDADMAENKKHPFHSIFQGQFGIANAIAAFINSSKPVTQGADDAQNS